MEERLANVVDRMGLDIRSRRIVLTMPGLSFGFVPKHYDGFIERIDCPTCSQMMDFVDEAIRPDATVPPEEIPARLDALKAACPLHWGTAEAIAISEQLMGAYVRSDRLVHGTIAL